MTGEKEKNAIMIGGVLVVVVLTVIFTRSYLNSRPLKVDTGGQKSIAMRDETVFPLVESSELEQLLRENRSNIALIDIRSAADFADVHIPQAKNLSLSTLTQEQLMTLPQKIIVIIGYDDEQLTDPFFAQKPSTPKRIVYLDGGFARWQKESVTLISSGNPQKVTDHMKMIPITEAQLREIVASGNLTYAIVDVRSAADFARGAIPGAINIPLAEIESRERDVPIGKIVIVYGENDLTGFQGAVRFHDLGFLGVQSLTGGFEKWQNPAPVNTKEAPIE